MCCKRNQRCAYYTTIYKLNLHNTHLISIASSFVCHLELFALDGDPVVVFVKRFQRCFVSSVSSEARRQWNAKHVLKHGA